MSDTQTIYVVTDTYLAKAEVVFGVEHDNAFTVYGWNTIFASKPVKVCDTLSYYAFGKQGGRVHDFTYYLELREALEDMNIRMHDKELASYNEYKIYANHRSHLLDLLAEAQRDIPQTEPF